MLLKLRGRVRHHDEFGLSYWLWENTRALGTPKGQPRTDDKGVLLQLQRVYGEIGQPEPESGSVVSVDAGAYIGIVSLAMAHFGPANQVVHSFEADEVNYARLLENVAAVLEGSIVLHRQAVSDFEGTADFSRNQDPGTNTLSITQDGSADSISVVSSVPVTTLDALARKEKIDRIDVLKIDVEGADLEVIRGASGLLAAGRVRAIVVEIALTVERRTEMNDVLREHGLTLAYIVRNSEDLIPATEASFDGASRKPLNMLAVDSKLAESLGIGE
jgi:FkbM family methyltransferase